MGEFTDKAKGKAKQFEASLTGDKARKREGIADEIKGNLKGVTHKIGDATCATTTYDSRDKIRSFFSMRPFRVFSGTEFNFAWIRSAPGFTFAGIMAPRGRSYSTG